jgi:hypothetical protein
MQHESPQLPALRQAARAAYLTTETRTDRERLARAIALVVLGHVRTHQPGHYEVSSFSRPDQTHTVNASCTCEDAHHNGNPWCLHRLAVALLVRAHQLESSSEPSSGEDPPTDAPLGPTADVVELQAGPNPEPEPLDPADANEITLRVAYSGAIGPRNLAVSTGTLVDVRADGQLLRPWPAPNLRTMYLWLQNCRFAPAAFTWENRNPGDAANGIRRQTYRKETE